MFGIFNRAIDSIARRLPACPRGVMAALKSSTNELVGSAAIIRDTSEQRLAEELFGLAVEACRSGMLMIDRYPSLLMHGYPNDQQRFSSQSLGCHLGVPLVRKRRQFFVQLRVVIFEKP